MRRNGNRGGFTLIEVITVSVVIGILAGISTPTLARAIDRAAAAKVVADARNLTTAVRSYIEAGGTLGASEVWGVAPSSLGPYLESTMSFTYRDVEYRYVTLPAIDLAELWVRYPVDSGVGEALLRFRRPGEVTWTPTQTTFVLAK